VVPRRLYDSERGTSFDRGRQVRGRTEPARALLTHPVPLSIPGAGLGLTPLCNGSVIPSRVLPCQPRYRAGMGIARLMNRRSRRLANSGMTLTWMTLLSEAVLKAGVYASQAMGVPLSGARTPFFTAVAID
jgi:hypothetical protein